MHTIHDSFVCYAVDTKECAHINSDDSLISEGDREIDNFAGQLRRKDTNDGQNRTNVHFKPSLA